MFAFSSISAEYLQKIRMKIWQRYREFKGGNFLRHSVVLIPIYIDTKSTTIAQEVPEL